MKEPICNYEWRAPRRMINTSGEAFETTPVNHICQELLTHNDELLRHNHPHKCPCGESIN